MKLSKVLSASCLVLLSMFFSNLTALAQVKPEPAKSVNITVPKNDNKENENEIIQDQTGDKNPAAENNNKRYRLGYQDTVEVTVYKHGEFNQTTTISPDGTIVLPKIDQPIVAVCKTERELKQTIENLYKTYLRNPYVNVRTVDQRSQPFAVIGAVKNPGSFYLKQRIQLLSLLALAGGPNLELSGSSLRIARIGNVDTCDENLGFTADNSEDEIKFITYDLKDVQNGIQNPWMQPGDVVSVLEADEAYVIGNVFKPAKVSLKEPKTLTQAIAAAGGTNATAKLDKIVIERQEPGTSVKKEMIFNLKDIYSKKIDDPQILANDIINISNDNYKSVRNGFIKAISGGIGNIFYRFP